MVNIAVLISGGGTNLQAILDAAERGEIKKGKVALVISSKADAYGLKRAEKAGVPTKVISKKDYTKPGDFEEELIRVLQENEIGLVVLAGFMVILNQRFTRTFAGKIINVHPSLIPSFCGDGFYGLKVHEKALEYGVKVTGATVHFVNEVTDGGEIILQDCVPIQEEDTPQSLQKKVMEQVEWKILPKAVSLFCEGRLQIEGRRVRILEEGRIKNEETCNY